MKTSGLSASVKGSLDEEDSEFDVVVLITARDSDLERFACSNSTDDVDIDADVDADVDADAGVGFITDASTGRMLSVPTPTSEVSKRTAPIAVLRNMRPKKLRFHDDPESEIDSSTAARNSVGGSMEYESLMIAESS
jgi:hypothetical protein